MVILPRAKKHVCAQSASPVNSLNALLSEKCKQEVQLSPSCACCCISLMFQINLTETVIVFTPELLVQASQQVSLLPFKCAL